MNTIKLRLTNNSTIDLHIPDEDLDAELAKLGEVMTDPLSLYTLPLGRQIVILPGRNILFLEVSEDEEDAEGEAEEDAAAE